MDNSIYEVDRDEYKTFIGQLDMKQMHTEEAWIESVHTTKIVSDNTGLTLCTRLNDNEIEEEHYFIFHYPQDNERIAPKPILHINLETREEVQSFFNALTALQREASQHD